MWLVKGVIEKIEKNYYGFFSSVFGPFLNENHGMTLTIRFFSLVDYAIAGDVDIVILFKPAKMKRPSVGLLVKNDDEGWVFQGGKQGEGGLL